MLFSKTIFFLLLVIFHLLVTDLTFEVFMCIYIYLYISIYTHTQELL